jgi:5-methylcytosine-specific restriction endonuclease McrA
MADTNKDEVCIECGSPLPSRRRSYCSDACKNAKWDRYWNQVRRNCRTIKGDRTVSWGFFVKIQLRKHPICARCGETKNLEVHHIIALKSGGTNEAKNLITLCHSCHRAQHRTTPIKNDQSRTIQGALCEYENQNQLE